MIPGEWKYITIHTAELQQVSWHLLFVQIIELGSIALLIISLYCEDYGRLSPTSEMKIHATNLQHWQVNEHVIFSQILEDNMASCASGATVYLTKF